MIKSALDSDWGEAVTWAISSSENSGRRLTVPASSAGTNWVGSYGLANGGLASGWRALFSSGQQKPKAAQNNAESHS